MKFLKILIVLLMILLFDIKAFSKTYTILIIDSYKTSYFCEEPQINGFKYGLKYYFPNSNFVIWEYCFNKLQVSDKEIFLKDFIKFLRKIRPDYIILGNEDTFDIFLPFLLYSGYNGKILFFSINIFLYNFKKSFFRKNTKLSGICEQISLKKLFLLFQVSKIHISKIFLLTTDSVLSFYETQNYLNELSKYRKGLLRNTKIKEIYLSDFYDYKNFVFSLGNETGVILIFFSFTHLFDKDYFHNINLSLLLKMIKTKNVISVSNFPYSLQLGVSFVISPNYFVEGFNLAKLFYKMTKNNFEILTASNLLYINLQKIKENRKFYGFLKPESLRYVDFIFGETK